MEPIANVYLVEIGEQKKSYLVAYLNANGFSVNEDGKIFSHDSKVGLISNQELIVNITTYEGRCLDSLIRKFDFLKVRDVLQRISNKKRPSIE